jgi:hypothetical protein
MAEEKRSREKLTVAVDPPIKRCSVAPTSSTSPRRCGAAPADELASEVAGQPAIRLTAATVLGAGGDAVCALGGLVRAVRVIPLTSTKRWRSANWPPTSVR